MGFIAIPVPVLKPGRPRIGATRVPASIGSSVLLGCRIAVLRGSRFPAYHLGDQHLHGLDFNYL